MKQSRYIKKHVQLNVWLLKCTVKWSIGLMNRVSIC